jgi:hypothetical protein
MGNFLGWSGWHLVLRPDIQICCMYLRIGRVGLVGLLVGALGCRTFAVGFTDLLYIFTDWSGWFGWINGDVFSLVNGVAVSGALVNGVAVRGALAGVVAFCTCPLFRIDSCLFRSFRLFVVPVVNCWILVLLHSTSHFTFRICCCAFLLKCFSVFLFLETHFVLFWVF